MVAEISPVSDAVNALVDDYRARCLWFLRANYYPVVRAQQLRVLDYIERHGDRAAHLRVAVLRQWLSQNSNGESAVS